MTNELISTHPRWNLQLDAEEAVLIYHGLRLYLQSLSEHQDLPTDTLLTLAELLQVVKPAAVQAATFLGETKMVAPG